eukprot:6769275-Pyramimonas_sp.AAC.1
MSMRADEDTFLNLPFTSTSQPYVYDEYRTAWIFEKNPIAEEEACGRGAAKACMTAQTFEQVSRFHGHAINRLNLTKRLYVSGVAHGAAICDESLRCNIACEGRGDPAGQPAVPRLDMYSAN